jgi:hypothetical protein
MADWTLVPCLIALRSEFNRLAPGRDHASDGSIGDPAHAASVSDHNPAPDGQVHAIDVDSDLRLTGWDMNRCLQIIIGRHRGGADNRLQNVIYNRRIWSRSWGWTARAYTGSNAHTQHAHFSARYTTAQENDTRPWGLLEAADMPLSGADKAFIQDAVATIRVTIQADAQGRPTQQWDLDDAVGYGARKSYEAVRDLSAFAVGEAQRDAQTAATLAAMQTALSALAATNGALSPAEVQALTEQVRQAAKVAGAEAASALTAEVRSLRRHLGDDTPIAG